MNRTLHTSYFLLHTYLTVVDITSTILIAIVATVAGVAATVLYYRQRTRRRVRELTLLVKRLAMGDVTQNLDNFDVPVDTDLRDLRDAIGQLARELRAIIQRISTERNTMAALLENMTDGIISTNSEGRVIGINNAARSILNLPPSAKVEGMSFMQVVRDHDLFTLLRGTLADGQERGQVLEVGPRRPQLQVKITQIQPEWGMSGRAEAEQKGDALVVLRDLTELTRLERIRRDFVANISHELRTPLASVKLMAETLQAVLEDDPDEARAFLRRIDNELDSLTQLVRELLDLSRIESGQVKLNLKSVEMRELVEMAADRMRAQAERNGLQLKTQPRGGQDSFPLALADPDRVMQVLVNLIHNSIKFTPVGGTIELAVNRNHARPDKLQISLSDTGVGIPPDDLDRIFERFYKVDKARASGESGTGLGLAISKHIVQAHGGAIWAESEYGRGTTFHFTIPIFDL